MGEGCDKAGQASKLRSVSPFKSRDGASKVHDFALIRICRTSNYADDGSDRRFAGSEVLHC